MAIFNSYVSLPEGIPAPGPSIFTKRTSNWWELHPGMAIEALPIWLLATTWALPIGLLSINKLRRCAVQMCQLPRFACWLNYWTFVFHKICWSLDFFFFLNYAMFFRFKSWEPHSTPWLINIFVIEQHLKTDESWFIVNNQQIANQVVRRMRLVIIFHDFPSFSYLC